MRSFPMYVYALFLFACSASPPHTPMVPLVTIDLPFPQDVPIDKPLIRVPMMDAAVVAMNATPLSDDDDGDAQPLPTPAPDPDGPPTVDDPTVTIQFDPRLVYPNQLILCCLFCIHSEAFCSTSVEAKRQEARDRGLNINAIDMFCYTVPLPSPAPLPRPVSFSTGHRPAPSGTGRRTPFRHAASSL